MIFSFVRPYEDETLYSFMKRLADANATTYEHMNQQFGNNARYNLVTYENMAILKSMNYPIPGDEILMKHTLFPLVAPLFDEITQTAWINIFDRNRTEFPKMIPMIRNRFNGRKVCPLCMKEDRMNNHEIIFRRSHQAPGVSVCWKHGAKLIDYGDEKTEEHHASDFESLYARFCHEMLNADLQCSRTDIRLYLGELIETKFDSVQSAIDYVCSKADGSLKTEDATGLISRFVYGGHYATTAPANILLFLSALSSSSEIIDRFSSEKKILSVSKDYRIIKSYGIFAVVEHECGERFLATGYGFDAGWRCPRCDTAKNDEEKFAEIVSNVNPDYKIISRYLGPQKYVEVEHSCGRKQKLRAKYMLEDRICQCERGPTEEEMKDLAESRGYVFLSAERTSSQATTILKLKHKECGHIIFKSMSDLKRRSSCPYCRRNSGFSVSVLGLEIKNTEDYKKAVKDLVGDSYTVISADITDSDEKMAEIRCNKCGKITTMPARDFLVGRRCTCESFPYGDELPDFVEEATDGIYRIRKAEDSPSNFNVLDDKGNIVAKNVSKPLIMAELRRPTQSPILPLPESVRKNVKNTLIGILPYIRNAFAENPERDLTVNDLVNERYSAYDINMKLSFLQRRGELYRVKEGVYHSVNDPNFHKDRIMTEKTFEIRELIWLMVKDKKEPYTISELSEATGYSLSQIGTALVGLDKSDYIHRIAMGTYVNGPGKDFVTVPDQVLEYIKENLNDRAFSPSDIVIPGLTRAQISDALKKFPKKGLAERIKKGVYIYTGRDKLREKSMEDIVMDIINKDITRDYKTADFKCLNKPINQVSAILGRLVRKNYLFRVSKGVFHSTEDIKTEDQ